MANFLFVGAIAAAFSLTAISGISGVTVAGALATVVAARILVGVVRPGPDIASRLLDTFSRRSGALAGAILLLAALPVIPLMLWLLVAALFTVSHVALSMRRRAGA